jgi:hypothetical protein
VLLKEWKGEYFGRNYAPAVLGKTRKKYRRGAFPKNTTFMTKEQAEDKAYSEIGDKLPDNAELDAIIPIERCASQNVCSVVGYNVYFAQEYNGLPLRSNSTVDYVSVLVSDKGVIMDLTWTEIIPMDYSPILTEQLSVREALKKASDGISNVIKEPVTIVSYKRAYGISAEGGFAIIVPAYEFIGANGERFVVDVYSGRLLK